jgi:hypothetical protein
MDNFQLSHRNACGWTSTRGKPKEGINKLSASQLLVCCVNLNIESLLTFFPQRDVDQLLTYVGLITYGLHIEGTWKLLKKERSPLNKL